MTKLLSLGTYNRDGDEFELHNERHHIWVTFKYFGYHKGIEPRPQTVN